MKTKIKIVQGEDIWLETTSDVGIVIPSIAIILTILSAGFFLQAILSMSELSLKVAVGCFVMMLFCLVLIACGIISKPAYSVYSCGKVSQIVPILNDGTDQARVCIAAKEIERQILEDYNNVKNLEKIAEGCK